MSSEGVLIFPVKSIHAPYQAPYQPSCSPKGSTAVKSGHSRFRGQAGAPTDFGFRPARPFVSGFARLFAVLLLVVASAAAMAQSLTIEQIRVIGNRRIPKETVLARLFTHTGDTYDPVSIERDFN